MLTIQAAPRDTLPNTLVPNVLILYVYVPIKNARYHPVCTKMHVEAIGGQAVLLVAM